MILTLPALFVGLMVTPKPVVIVDLKPREELRGQLTHPEADVAKIAKTHSLKLVETEGATVLLSEDALGIPSLRAKTRLVDALISALDPDSQVLRAERLPKDVCDHLRSALAYLGGELKVFVERESFRLLLAPSMTVRLKSGTDTIELRPHQRSSDADENIAFEQSGPIVKVEPSESAFSDLFQPTIPSGLWIGSTASTTVTKAAVSKSALDVWVDESGKVLRELEEVRNRLTDRVTGLTVKPGTKLTELDPSVQRNWRRMIEMNHGHFGFSDAAAAQRFLDRAVIDKVWASTTLRGVSKVSGGGVSASQIEFRVWP